MANLGVVLITLAQILSSSAQQNKKVMQNGIAVNGGRVSYQKTKLAEDTKGFSIPPMFVKTKKESIEEIKDRAMLSNKNFPKEHNYHFDQRKYLKIDRVDKRINKRINTDSTVNGGYKDMFEPLTYSVTRRRRASGANSTIPNKPATTQSTEIEFEKRYARIVKSSTTRNMTSSETTKTGTIRNNIQDSDPFSFSDIVVDTDFLLNDSFIEDYDLKNNGTKKTSNDIPKKTRSLFSDLIEIPRSKDITIIKPSQIDVFGVVVKDIDLSKEMNAAKAKAAVTEQINKTKLSDEYEEEKHLTISDALKLTNNPPPELFESKSNNKINDSVVPLNESVELKKIEEEEKLLPNQAPLKLYTHEKNTLPYNQTNDTNSNRLSEKSLIRILSVLLTTFKKIILQHQRMKKMHRDVMIASKDVMTKRLEVLSKLSDFDKRHKMLLKQGSHLATLQNIFSGKQEIFLRKEKEFFDKRNEFEVLKNKFLEQQRQFFKLKEEMEIVMNTTKLDKDKNNDNIKDGARKINRITQLITKGNEILDHNLQTLSTYNSSSSKRINKTERIRWSEKLYDLNFIDKLLLDKDYNDIDELVHKYYFRNTTIDRILKNLTKCNCKDNFKSTAVNPFTKNGQNHSKQLLRASVASNKQNEKNKSDETYRENTRVIELRRQKRRADDDRNYKPGDTTVPVELSMTEINPKIHSDDNRKSRIDEEHSNLSTNRESDESSYSYVAEKHDKNDEQSEETFKFILKKNKNKPHHNYEKRSRYTFLSQEQPKIPNHFLTTDRNSNIQKEDTFNNNEQEKDQNHQLKSVSYSHDDENNDHRFSDKEINLREDKQLKIILNEKLPSEPSPFQPEEPNEPFKSGSTRNERLDDSHYRYLTNINTDSPKDDFSREIYNKVPIENINNRRKDIDDIHKQTLNDEQRELPIEVHSREKIDDSFSKEIIHKSIKLVDSHNNRHFSLANSNKEDYNMNQNQYYTHSKENDSGRKSYEKESYEKEKNDKNMPLSQTTLSRELQGSGSDAIDVKKEGQITKENSAENSHRHHIRKPSQFFDSADFTQKEDLTKSIHSHAQNPSISQKYHGLTIDSDSNEMYNTYSRKQSAISKDPQVENHQSRHSSERNADFLKQERSREHYKNYVEDDSVQPKKVMEEEVIKPTKKYSENEGVKQIKIYLEDDRVKSPDTYLGNERIKSSKKYLDDERVKPTKKYMGEERIATQKKYVDDDRIKPSKNNYLEDDRVKPSNSYIGNERVKSSKNYVDDETIKSSNVYVGEERIKQTEKYLDDDRIKSSKNYFGDERIKSSIPYSEDERLKSSKNYVEEERSKLSKNYVEEERVKPSLNYLEDERQKSSRNYLEEDRLKSSKNIELNLNTNLPRSEVHRDFNSKEIIRTITEKVLTEDITTRANTPISELREESRSRDNVRVSSEAENPKSKYDKKEDHRYRYVSEPNEGNYENNNEQLKSYEINRYVMDRKHNNANNHESFLHMASEINSLEKLNDEKNKEMLKTDNRENKRLADAPEKKREKQKEEKTNKVVSSTPFAIHNSEERKSESRYTFYSEKGPDTTTDKSINEIENVYKSFLSKNPYVIAEKVKSDLILNKKQKEDHLKVSTESVKNGEKHKTQDEKPKESMAVEEVLVNTPSVKLELKQNLTKSIKSARKLSKILEHSILHSLLKARKYVAEASAENIENLGNTLTIDRKAKTMTTVSVPKLVTTTTSEKPDILNVLDDESTLVQPSKSKNEDPFNIHPQSTTESPSKKKKTEKSTDVVFAKMVKKFLKKVKRKLNITI